MSREENPKEDVHELSELEGTLAALVPRAERLNRDRLMFLAGQASVESKSVNRRPSRIAGPKRPTGCAWPAAFATMTAIAASLLAALANGLERANLNLMKDVPLKAENDAGIDARKQPAEWATLKGRRQAGRFPGVQPG